VTNCCEIMLAGLACFDWLAGSLLHRGTAMAKAKKRLATRKKSSKRRKVSAKKAAKPMRPKKAKSKIRQTGPRVLKSIAKKKRPPKAAAKMAPRKAPVVEDTIIDVIDKPVPGVVRVTEYETVRITTPKQDADSDADE
jgi:hypothetical protein